MQLISEWTPGAIILVIIIAVVGSILIRISINFDVNQFHERRQKRLDAKLMNACPHVRFKEIHGEMRVEAASMKPPGTLIWTCEMCGRQTYSNVEEQGELVNKFAENPTEYVSRIGEFNKLLKKAGYV